MKPIVTRDDKPGAFEGSTVQEHPAFGQISASRCHGGNSTLYGSDFKHNGYVTVTISGSKLRRDLSNDWHHPTDEKIEVALSEAQWATFVSTLNHGSGVPCTIKRVGLMPVADIEPHETTAETFKGEMGQRLEKGLASLAAAVELASDKDQKPSVAKLRPMIEAALSELRGNTNFVRDQFDEHMETSIEKAKIEAEAYLQSIISRAGLTALTAPAEELKQIEHGDEQ